MSNEITKLKILYATMSEKLDNLSTTVCRIETKLDQYIEKDEARSDNFKKEMDKKYASKRIEKIVDGLVWFILITVLGAGLFLVIK